MARVKLAPPKPRSISVSKLIERAGGVATVALGLKMSIHTVLKWQSGARRPMGSPTRAALAVMAGVEVQDVDWNAAAREFTELRTPRGRKS